MKILLYFEVCNASAISFHGIFLEYFFAKQLCYMITKTMVPDHMFCEENYRKKKQKGITVAAVLSASDGLTTSPNWQPHYS